ncbi:hypothetical protein HPC49_38100 [Pyxidicoccus fallax]|uniref:Uncharacterized protein n=1 Tax=Pyxidicoccus fallax TaxID=394095 RepID=A0A848LRL4_9BACT|nr:DUF5819 family protein [Pyxidicoccus fallax]NMO20568.1 hypothetical protein [Pyxidicoccus fallax]NPC84015.1 hypothetical protein [Pyxidicoccus fallax]
MLRLLARSARGVGLAVRVFTLAGLVAHFALTLLYVFPLNPVKMELGFLANLTIGAYFPQNWSLFAPTPVQTTQELLVRCLKADEVPADPSQPLPTEGWEDVSSAHFKQAQRHRLSSYERLVRPLQNSLRTYLNGGPDLYPFHDACAKGDAEACKVRDTALKPRREQAARMFRRIGSAFCREAFPNATFSAVALRFRERGAVPWSARADGQPKLQDFELGLYKLDETVSLPGFYEAEGT